MLIAVSIVTIGLSVLIYHQPPSTWLEWLYTHLFPSQQPRLAASDGSNKDQLPISLEPLFVPPSDETSTSPASSTKSTPKVTPSNAQNVVAVPTFTLGEPPDETEEGSDEEDNMPPPSFPALNSAQRASGPSISTSMAPPSASRTQASSLMPPPQIRPSSLRPLPTQSQGLRVPTTGPLPNRGPVPSRAPGSGLAPAPIAGRVPTTPNARGKILLAPGHSPLDWANLQRSGTNLAGVESMIRVTPSMLKEHNGRKGRPAWSSYQGKVYNITPYLPYHPGGEGELRRAAGKDGGKLFMEVHPWVNWENMLGDCVVGVLVSEEQGQQQSLASSGDGAGSLEDMD